MSTLTPAQARAKHRESFEKFWSAYPRHTHISEAQNVWAKLMEEGADSVRIIGAARRYAESVGNDLKYVPGPNNWLAHGRYDDADLFEDENAANRTWLRQQWQTVNVHAVEDRFHIAMPKVYPPDEIEEVDAIQHWYREQARAWIASVAKDRFQGDVV